MSRAKQPPRVVFDTNVVLSALVFSGGSMEALRRAWQGGECTPLVNSITVGELLRVLAYLKFKLGVAEREELLADYLPYCTTIPIPAKLPRTIHCRDADDRPFLHLAIAGKADFLVSGDGDLLSLDGQFVCPILTPDEFIKRSRLYR